MSTGNCSGGAGGAGSVPSGGQRARGLLGRSPWRLRHVWLIDLAEHSRFARRQARQDGHRATTRRVGNGALTSQNPAELVRRESVRGATLEDVVVLERHK